MLIPDADAGENDTICGLSYTLLAVPSLGTGTWSSEMDVSFSDINDPNAVATVTELGTYEIIWTEVDADGSDIDTVLITFQDFPAFSIGEDIPFHCFGDSLQLQATPGFETYSWSPNTSLSDNTLADPFFGPVSNPGNIPLTFTYTVTAVDEHGCEVEDQMNITVMSFVPTDAGNDSIICAGAAVQLGASAVGPAGTTYLWSPAEGMDDPSAERPTVSPEETTTYEVLSSNGSCTGSDLITVLVDPRPNMDISFLATPTCEGLQVDFDNVADPTLGYAWDLGDGTRVEAYELTHIYAYGADYTVELSTTTEMGCEYSEDALIEVSSFDTYFEIVLPNVITPNQDGNNDVLDINVQGKLADCLDLQVYDRWGLRVFQSTGSNTRWDGYTIAGERVQAGAYYYVVNFNGVSYKSSLQVLY